MIGLLTQLRTRGHALWRRRWIALGTAWALMLLGSTVVVLLPDQYEVSARVYVDTDSLMGPLLKGIAVQDDLTQQLAVMQSTLLARPNLLKVARSVDLDLDTQNEVQLESTLDKIQARTSIEVTGSKLFKITHVDPDPRRAKDLVQAFLGIFVENNLGQDREDMDSAQSFIAKQLSTYETQLRATEKRMADFRAQHPELSVSASSGSSFLARLDKARTDVAEAEADLAKAKDQKERLAAQVKSAPELVESSSLELQPDDANVAKLAELKDALNKKLAIYSDQHPEVVTLKKQLANLEMQSADAAVNRGEQRLANAKDTLKQLEDTASSSPMLEAEMADMNRDYAVLKQQYDQLRVRAESARISRAAKTDTAAMRFRVIEPPELPVRPSGPKRTLLLIAVLCASIGGGLGIAFLLSEMDDSFATPGHLREAFKLPLLGTVCLVPSEAEQAKLTYDAITVSAGAGAMVVLCGLLIVLTSGLIQSAFDLTPLRHLASGLFGAGA